MARVTIRSIGVSRDSRGQLHDASGHYISQRDVDRLKARELHKREEAEAAQARSDRVRRSWETRRREAAELASIGRRARREPYREAAPTVRPPRLLELRPLAEIGLQEAAKLKAKAEAAWAEAGDLAGRARDLKVAEARSLEASAARAERGAIAADKGSVTLADPVQVRGSFAKWRDAAGRFVRAGTPGARKEMHVKSALDHLGERARPLLKALLDYQKHGSTWDDAGDAYYRRAVALGLAG